MSHRTAGQCSQSESVGCSRRNIHLWHCCTTNTYIPERLYLWMLHAVVSNGSDIVEAGAWHGPHLTAPAMAERPRAPGKSVNGWPCHGNPGLAGNLHIPPPLFPTATYAQGLRPRLLSLVQVLVNFRYIKTDGSQNLERPNIERPVFRKFETSNIEITKVVWGSKFLTVKF